MPRCLQTQHKPKPKSDMDMFCAILEGATGWSRVPPPPLSAGSDGRDLVLTAALPSLRCDRSRHHTTSLGLLSHLASRDISPASVTSWGGCKEQKMQIHFKVFISWIMSNQLSLNPSLHHSPLGLKVGVREPKKRRLPRKEVQSNF